MALTQAEVADVHLEFDAALEALARQEAGAFRGDPEGPLPAFLAACHKLARNPIEHPAHLEMLRKAVEPLRVEQPQLYVGTLDEAIDAALEAALELAMDCAEPLQLVLLGLARYQIVRPRLDA